MRTFEKSLAAVRELTGETYHQTTLDGVICLSWGTISGVVLVTVWRDTGYWTIHEEDGIGLLSHHSGYGVIDVEKLRAALERIGVL